jgi:deoxyribodipyrimidine photolyase-like uncharacterized protein
MRTATTAATAASGEKKRKRDLLDPNRTVRNKTGNNKRHVDRKRYKRLVRKTNLVSGDNFRFRKKDKKRKAVTAAKLEKWAAEEKMMEDACVLLAEAFQKDITLVWDSTTVRRGVLDPHANRDDLSATQIQGLIRKALGVRAYYRAVLSFGMEYSKTRCRQNAAKSDGALCNPESIRRCLIDFN